MSSDRQPVLQTTRRRAAGFSLLEIMVVLVIIGMLAGLVVINVRSRMVIARQSAAKAELATLAEALESYYMIYGQYPTNDQGIDALTKKTEKLPEPLIERLPKDPWGRPYVYITPAHDRPYEVICLGADGAEGGDGADADLSSANLSQDDAHAS